MKFTKGQKIEVEWIDAAKSVAWWDEEDLVDMPTRAKTTGYFVARLVKNKVSGIIIADSLNIDRNSSRTIGGPTFIPTASIYKARKLR